MQTLSVTASSKRSNCERLVCIFCANNVLLRFVSSITSAICKIRRQSAITARSSIGNDKTSSINFSVDNIKYIPLKLILFNFFYQGFPTFFESKTSEVCKPRRSYSLIHRKPPRPGRQNPLCPKNHHHHHGRSEDEHPGIGRFQEAQQ